MRRFFDRAAFGLFVALVVWAPIPLGSNRPWAWAILEVGIFACGIMWLVAWARREVEWTSAAHAARPVLMLLLLWLAWVLLQWLPLPAAWVRALSPAAAAMHAGAGYINPGGSLTLSIDPHATRVFWLMSCAFALAFALVLLLVHDRRRLRWLAYTVVLAGLLEAVYGSLMHLTGTDITVLGTVIPNSEQASGTFVNRNHLAGLLEMSLAIGIGLMIAQLQDRRARSWKQLARDWAGVVLSPKAPLRVLLVVMVVALVMTRSRMGNTAFFASLLVAGAIALILSRHATRNMVMLIASLIAIDIFVIGAWFGVERTVQRIEQTTVGDVQQRMAPGEYAVRIARDYPVFGSGGGTFYTAFTRYRIQRSPFYDYAENDYLQVLAETGPIGLGLLGSITLLSLFAAVLAQSRRRDPLARGVGFASVMGITALLIHSTTDFNLQIPANAFVFVILLAFGWIALHLDRAERTSHL